MSSNSAMRTHVSSSSNLGPGSEDFNDLESPLLRTESQEYSEDHVHDKSGPVRFSANVFKAFVGSGILAIPFGMHEVRWILFLLPPHGKVKGV